MLGSSILDAAIGLIFLYVIFSLACTTFNELLASLLKWRSKSLWEGVQNLLERDPNWDAGRAVRAAEEAAQARALEAKKADAALAAAKAARQAAADRVAAAEKKHASLEAIHTLAETAVTTTLTGGGNVPPTPASDVVAVVDQRAKAADAQARAAEELAAARTDLQAADAALARATEAADAAKDAADVAATMVSQTRACAPAWDAACKAARDARREVESLKNRPGAANERKAKEDAANDLEDKCRKLAPLPPDVLQAQADEEKARVAEAAARVASPTEALLDAAKKARSKADASWLKAGASGPVGAAHREAAADQLAAEAAQREADAHVGDEGRRATAVSAEARAEQSKTAADEARGKGDDPSARRLYDHPLIQALYQNSAGGKKKPSYIPSQTFATALLDLVSPAARLAGRPETFAEIRAAIAKIPENPVNSNVRAFRPRGSRRGRRRAPGATCRRSGRTSRAGSTTRWSASRGGTSVGRKVASSPSRSR